MPSDIVAASLSNRVRLVLVATAVGALAIGTHVDLGSGWLRLLMIAVGGLCLLASIPAVEHAARLTLIRALDESPAALADLKGRPSVALLYAVWFALAASAGEAAYRSYQKFSGSHVLSSEYLWRIPLGNLLFLGAVGFLFMLAARWKPSWPWFPVAISAFAFVAVAGVLFLVGDLHDVAAAVLAAGLAVQVGRIATRYTFLVHRTIRATLPWLVAFVLGAGLAVAAWPRWQERRALAALPVGSSEARPPDVLFVVLDTVRAKSLSLYGYARATSPRLSAFAARGVVFDRAFSTSPWTLPAHGSMFTGRWPHELSGGFMAPLDDTYPTLAEALGRQAYVTAGFVANRIYGAAEFGLSRGFVHYEDRAVSPMTALTGASFPSVLLEAAGLRRRFATHENFGLKSAEQVNRDYLNWLAARRDDRPSFVFLNYYDAHAPYFSPDEFATRFSPVTPRGDIWARPLEDWSPAEIQELNDAYDSTIAYLDHHLGELLATLDARGALAHTMVIITSDHGEQFGEHGLLEHANSLYLPLLHVPLVIVYPGAVPPGRRIDVPVSVRDLPATIFDLTGVPDPVGFAGLSMRATWSSDATWASPLVAETQQAYAAYPDHYPARKGPMTSIIADGMHYIRNDGDGREELYDIGRDAGELVDLAGDLGRLETYRRILREVRGNVR